MWSCFSQALSTLFHACLIHCLIAGLGWGEEKIFYQKQITHFDKGYFMLRTAQFNGISKDDQFKMIFFLLLKP